MIKTKTANWIALPPVKLMMGGQQRQWIRSGPNRNGYITKSANTPYIVRWCEGGGDQMKLKVLEIETLAKAKKFIEQTATTLYD